MEDDTEVLDLESRSIADLQQTRADRLRQSVTAPDFSPTTIQTTKDVLSESVMELSDAERSDILRSAGVYSSTSKQTATAIENALIGMNQLGDETTIAFGNIANYITGGALGQELQDIAYESMAHRYAAMADNEDAIGGIRSELAQLAGGATSFLQLALEGIATAGVLPNVHIGIQAFGEGAYNDMKAYADNHDGSLEGYKPKGIDLAVNTANALLQVYIEEKFGVGSPRFFVGASRGFVQEGLSGALQESTQGVLSDLAEVVKDNQEIGTILENADQYIRDAVIGGLLQGAMGAATYHQNYAKAANNVATAIAKARGHETPTAEDQQQAEKIVDAKERGYASALTTEFKAVFDASTGEGKLQQNIAAALKKAVEAQELDLGVADETEMAQKLEQIATQETLNALEMAQEQGRSVAEMELNNIVYKDGAIWLEGVTPQVGERAADYARVLAERQSGLAQAQMKLDALSREVQQTKKDLAEARAQSKQALVDKLQARLEKQNALAEKRRIQTEQLKAQTEKIQARLAKELEQKEAKAEPKPKMEPKAKQEQQKPAPKVEMPESQVEPVSEPVAEEPAKQPAEPKPLAKVAERAKKYKGEKKSVKAEREVSKRAKTPKELEAQLTEVYDRITAKMEEVTKKTLDEKVSDKERAQAEKTGPHKQKGDVYIAIIPQVNDVTGRYVLKYRNYARETRPSTIYGRFGGEFGEGSTGWGNYELFDTKEELQKAIDGLIAEYGEEYAFFDMQFVDDELKSMADGHQQEKPEALNYRNQELRDLEQQGFEEQYKIRTGREYQRDRAPLKTFSDYERGKAETELKRQDEERRIGEEDWGGKTPAEVATAKIGEVFDGLKKDYADVEKRGYITDKDSVAYGHDLDAGGKQFLNKNFISYMLMKYNLDPRVAEWVKENPDLLRNNYDQKTSWNYSSESDLVDVLGTEQDYAPDGFVREDDEGVVDDNYDYEQVVYKMPQTQEEFENKVVSAMYKQTAEALDIDEKELEDATLNDDRTPFLFQSETEYTGDTIEVDGKERTVYNSNGDRIAKSKEALTNFWRWFGDSVIKDKQGRPLVVYHGTKAQFDTFAKIQVAENGWGYYFTTDPTEARSYGEPMSVYLKLNSPVISTGQFNEKVSDSQIDDIVNAFVEKFITTQENKKMALDLAKTLKTYPQTALVDRLDGLLDLAMMSDTELPKDKMELEVRKLTTDITGIDSYMYYMDGHENYVAWQPTQIKSVDNRGTYSPDTGNILKQSKTEGTGSDKYRGGYDERLKRIVLGEKSDLTTIQHEFAHYWIQNNFKWARSGLASEDWLRRWRDVEEALGIEPQDRLLSRQASEKFARAYERYIMEGKVSEDLQWAFDGFQKFYQDTYEDLENEYFDLSEELDPAIVDWFNRQRPATEQSLKDQAYKNVAKVAMEQGAEIITDAGDGNFVVSSMDNNGNVVSDVVVSDQQTQDSKLAHFSDKKKNRRVVEGLRESNPDIQSDKYNVLNRAETVKEAHNWIVRDREGAWAALNDPNTNPIDRTALFQAFKNEAENGDYELGVQLASIKFPKEMTELGQAISVLGERPEFDPLTILETKQESLGEPTAEQYKSENVESEIDVELTDKQDKDIENKVGCVL